MSNDRELVHPEALLKQLDALWSEFGEEGSNGDSSSGILRACSLTWITVIEGDDAAVAEVDAMLAGVMRVHPSRAIVVLLRDGEERRLKGSVSAQCWRPFGSKQQVCIERVLLDTTRAGACDLPAVIRALIAADLPVVVFCRNAHLLSIPGVAETSTLADRVVVDIAWRAAECSDVWPRVPKLGKYVSDLAWDRIRGFRRGIASYFESPTSRELLSQFETLRVVTRAERPSPEAAYLLTWVLGCLGFQRAGDQPANDARIWHKDGLSVQAGFAASSALSADAAREPVSAIEFLGRDHALRFALHLADADSAWASEGPGRTLIAVPSIESDTTLLSDEMVVEHRRRTFEHHLEEAIRLFEEPLYLADQ